MQKVKVGLRAVHFSYQIDWGLNTSNILFSWWINYIFRAISSYHWWEDHFHLSVSYTVWSGDKRQTYAGEGKENSFPQMHSFFANIFKWNLMSWWLGEICLNILSLFHKRTSINLESPKKLFRRKNMKGFLFPTETCIKLDLIRQFSKVHFVKYMTAKLTFCHSVLLFYFTCVTLPSF
jgi:hypothetical protein